MLTTKQGQEPRVVCIVTLLLCHNEETIRLWHGDQGAYRGKSWCRSYSSEGASYDHPGRSMAAGRQMCIVLERSWEFTSRLMSMGWMRDFETSEPSPYHMPPLTRPLPNPCQSLTDWRFSVQMYMILWGPFSFKPPYRLTFAFWGWHENWDRVSLCSPRVPRAALKFMVLLPFPLKCWDCMYHYIPVPCGFCFCFSCLFVQYRISLCSPG